VFSETPLSKNSFSRLTGKRNSEEDDTGSVQAASEMPVSPACFY
jgi:hypothetical protein